MTRPKKKRKITKPPRFTEFKPAGIRNAALSKINLTLDEYEALRLADFDGLNHNAAAVRWKSHALLLADWLNRHAIK